MLGKEREFDYGLGPGERYEPGDDPDDVPFDRSTPHVMTVLGPIRPGELGVTLTHERVIAKPPRHLPDGPAPDPDLILDDPHAALAELEDLYASGGRAVVDATVAADGRGIAALHWVASRAPVHVIAVTGQHGKLQPGRTLARRSPDDIAAGYIAELTLGIDETAICAGAIMAGTSDERITPFDEIALRGAARAHLAARAPILVHGGRDTMALDQLALLTSEGVEPGRIVHCHPGHGPDEASLRSLLAVGVWVSFDLISPTGTTPSEGRAAMIAGLAKGGHGGQILLSGGMARRSSLRAYGGSPGLIYPVETFPLLLMDAGLDAPAVRRLLVDNPAKALTIG